MDGYIGVVNEDEGEPNKKLIVVAKSMALVVEEVKWGKQYLSLSRHTKVGVSLTCGKRRIVPPMYLSIRHILKLNCAYGCYIVSCKLENFIDYV